ncbi:uncharacterized protein L3040_004190 [Drepanopeziza brunnea f. sp. 'multigermtubi']|uniref:uncharacterized protein n=1 Tax=Drepanopeziza brunnea f. sp. 'multigermtubi' TaxID=698441 RepID=UPI00238C4389|nr:hypothetical protein L3040_004190 [Drepanopeziza brunnea f. sp. 'multigermtubi']
MSRLQPRLKALATSNVSSQSASATKDPQTKPETPVSHSNVRPPSADPVSDRATLFLIRRTLCSQLGEKGRNTPAPIDQLLPPLTSSNEVDLQLYAFISIIIREFVQVWYSKITPDQVFVEEVVKIIAHCTRALEQRLRKVDLESLLLDELPELLSVHVQACRASRQPLHPSPVESSPRDIYHSLWPFPALSPVPDGGQNILEQMRNESTYRQLLVQGVLAVLLPTEDLENDCLTSLVGQIFSEMILGGGIGGKASEPWLLWDGITKIAEVIKTRLPQSKAQVRVQRSNSDLGGSTPLNATAKGMKLWGLGGSLQKTFWLVLQYGFVAFTAVRFFLITLATASSLPSRIQPSTKINGSRSANGYDDPDPVSSKRQISSKQPILTMKIWSCASTLLDLEARMPWLNATLSLLQWAAITGPGEVGITDGMVDKILSHAIQTHLLDPTLLPQVLRIARAALFPNNAPGPPRLIPSPTEQLLIRRQCAETLLSLVPAKVQDVYFGPGIERRVREVEEALNVFDDAYCNKHLLYGIVELIIVRLMPEMAEKGIEELLEERLN